MSVITHTNPFHSHPCPFLPQLWPPAGNFLRSGFCWHNTPTYLHATQNPSLCNNHNFVAPLVAPKNYMAIRWQFDNLLLLKYFRRIVNETMPNKKVERTKIISYLNSLLENPKFVQVTIQQLSKSIKVDCRIIGFMLGHTAINDPLNKKLQRTDIAKLITLSSKNHIPDIIPKPPQKKKTAKKKSKNRKRARVVSTAMETNRRKH